MYTELNPNHSRVKKQKKQKKKQEEKKSLKQKQTTNISFGRMNSA